VTKAVTVTKRHFILQFKFNSLYFMFSTTSSLNEYEI